MIDLMYTPFSSWTFVSLSGIELATIQTPPNAARVSTQWSFGPPADGSMLRNGLGVTPGGVYRVRYWVNGINATDGGAPTPTVQRLILSIDRGDGAFLQFDSMRPRDFRVWTQRSVTFTALGPISRLRLACVTTVGSLLPIGTFNWYFDDVPIVAGQIATPDYGRPPRLALEWHVDALTGLLHPHDEVTIDRQGRVRDRYTLDEIDRDDWRADWHPRAERPAHEP